MALFNGTNEQLWEILGPTKDLFAQMQTMHVQNLQIGKIYQ